MSVLYYRTQASAMKKSKADEIGVNSCDHGRSRSWEVKKHKQKMTQSGTRQFSSCRRRFAGHVLGGGGGFISEDHKLVVRALYEVALQEDRTERRCDVVLGGITSPSSVVLHGRSLCCCSGTDYPGHIYFYIACSWLSTSWRQCCMGTICLFCVLRQADPRRGVCLFVLLAALCKMATGGMPHNQPLSVRGNW